ncbi:Tn3 family transposase [Nonomuraea sp. NPDC050536]|uniref:Tn3 family transposase n=1 Tax=Nonomuraea sp. NPDC050536 TaxID=3364366 RepID=UPI0037CBEC9A
MIEKHWTDLLRTAISIREGRVPSVTLLRRLGNHSCKHPLYRAFRELGRVIRTITLLRYLSEPEPREPITAITNKAEAFHGYRSGWLLLEFIPAAERARAGCVRHAGISQPRVSVHLSCLVAFRRRNGRPRDGGVRVRTENVTPSGRPGHPGPTAPRECSRLPPSQAHKVGPAGPDCSLCGCRGRGDGTC